MTLSNPTVETLSDLYVSAFLQWEDHENMSSGGNDMSGLFWMGRAPIIGGGLFRVGCAVAFVAEHKVDGVWRWLWAIGTGREAVNLGANAGFKDTSGEAKLAAEGRYLELLKEAASANAF